MLIDDYIDKVICGDCVDVMQGLPDGSIDLIFADPPFNIGKKYGISDNRDDYRDWTAKWIAEGFRILKPTGSFYHMTLTRHLEWKMPLMAKHGIFINLIKWHSVSACHNKRSFWNGYQPIMLYGKSKSYKFNTYAQTNFKNLILSGAASKSFRWGGYSTEYKGQLKDEWDDIPFVYAGSIHHPEAIIIEGTNKKAHPCQMPESLAERAILFSTDEKDIVLDPFFGSGTTGVACINTNRRYIGIEISQEYCDIANKRIEQARIDKAQADRQLTFEAAGV